jgi:hypothetical protein
MQPPSGRVLSAVPARDVSPYYSPSRSRLLVNALNPLAHPEAGLDAAINLMSEVVAFKLFSANLTASCALIIETLSRVVPDPAYS